MLGPNNLTADADAILGEEVGVYGLPQPRRRSQFDLCWLLDVTVALLALVFFAPVMCAVSIGIKLQDGGPILFGHTRIGRNGAPFKCWKFRSMVTDAEKRLSNLLASDPAARREWEESHKLRKDPRITAFGRLLRVSSLDELPQLLNVLAGEMSLVGPRPIVSAEVKRYGRWLRHYEAVRPGITGLWQVSGRSDLAYRERVAMDVLYAKHRSFAVNVRILAATIPAVLKRSGSY